MNNITYTKESIKHFISLSGQPDLDIFLTKLNAPIVYYYKENFYCGDDRNVRFYLDNYCNKEIIKSLPIGEEVIKTLEKRSDKNPTNFYYFKEIDGIPWFCKFSIFSGYIKMDIFTIDLSNIKSMVNIMQKITKSE